MNAATQFHGETGNGNYPDHGAVFFTEQGHGAPFLRFFNRHFLKGNGLGRQNLLIDYFFYFGQFFRGYLGEMGEVKMETVRAHIAAGLVHMIPQHLAQGCLQQVGSRMVPGNVRLADHVHFEGHFIAGGNGSFFYGACHIGHAIRQFFRFGNPQQPGRGFDDADVTQLAAPFRMEAGHVQDHRRVIAVGHRVHRLGVRRRIHLHNFTGMGGLVHFQFRRVQVPVIVNNRAAGFVVTGIPGHFALHFQRIGKAFFIQGHPGFFQNFRRQFLGEAESVGQFESDASVQFRFPFFFQPGDFPVQHFAAALQGFQETAFFHMDNFFNVVLFLADFRICVPVHAHYHIHGAA